MTSTDPSRDAVSNPHATAEQVEAGAAHDSKLAQVLYHDWEAETYDDKWSISYDQRCVDYARGCSTPSCPTRPSRPALRPCAGAGLRHRLLPAQPHPGRGGPPRLGHRPVARGWSRSPRATAENLGLEVDGRVADAEGIPYDDDTFDLVVGHAVLHHIPDVELSLREVVRVLKPGGRFVFAGEPTTVGNGYARRWRR